MWRKRGKVPAQHCPAIERETRRIATERGDASLVVTCEELNDQADWAFLRGQGASQPAEQVG